MPVIVSIQYWRAFAALAVVAFHLTVRMGSPVAVLAAGVDVFFVISGFILWRIATARPAAPGVFLWHRLIRIAPAYWLVTLVLATAVTRAPAGHLALSLLLVPHGSPSGDQFPLLAAGWTLQYEALFYLLFAASLSLPGRVRAPCLVAVLTALAAAGWLAAPAGAMLQTITSPLLLEFAAGLALGVLATAGRLRSRRWGAGLLVLGAASFMVQLWHPGPDAWRVLLWGGPAVCLAAGGLNWERAGGLAKASPPLLQLGAASYAIYLVHGPVLALCWRLLGGWPGPALALLGMAASVAAGLGFARWVEVPMTTWLRRPRWRLASPGRASKIAP